MILGLTGMSGAGKSTAAKLFAENGFCVIDCDTLAREIITRSPCVDEVKTNFPEVFTDDNFDRKKAAKVLFSNPQKLQQYQKIVFPYVTYGIIKEIEKSKDNILLDAPTLFQSKADDFCDEIIAVIADKSMCVERIVERDSVTENDAVMRLNNQPQSEFFKNKCDYIIENNGDTNDFKKEIEKISNSYTNLNNTNCSSTDNTCY